MLKTIASWSGRKNRDLAPARASQARSAGTTDDAGCVPLVEVNTAMCRGGTWAQGAQFGGHWQAGSEGS